MVELNPNCKSKWMDYIGWFHNHNPHHFNVHPENPWSLEREYLGNRSKNFDLLGENMAPVGKWCKIDRDGPSFYLEKGGVIPANRKMTTLLLCWIKLLKFCDTQQIADSVDLLWAFEPIYQQDQYRTQTLYKHHLNFKYYLASIGIPMVTVEAIFNG
jgi:hypothetical protein